MAVHPLPQASAHRQPKPSSWAPVEATEAFEARALPEGPSVPAVALACRSGYRVWAPGPDHAIEQPAYIHPTDRQRESSQRENAS